MSEQPGRYQRSVGGLIGALVISLAVIGAYVAFRALNREDLSVRPDPIDLSEAVEVADASNLRPVRPDPMPEGWEAISYQAIPKAMADGPAWGLGLHTEDGEYAGIRHDPRSLDALLEEYVDKDAVEGDEVTIESAVGSTWQTFSDAGGDHAYATELRGETLLVWGSASTDELQDLIGRLTDEPLSPR